MEEVVSQSTPEVSAPVVEAPKEATPTQSESPTIVGGAPQEAPQYQPNFKFKVKDAEHEIPEAFRSVVKDPETEKKVREIFEKAYGLDEVKQSRDKYQTQIKELTEREQKQYAPIMRQVMEAEAHYKRNDIGAVFKTLGIPENKVYEWALHQAKLADLPEDQKRIYTQSEEARRQEYQAQTQMEQMREQMMTLQVSQRNQELSAALTKSDVAALVQAFDAKQGAGAFQDEAIRLGQYYYHTQGKDVPVGQPKEKYNQSTICDGSIESESSNRVLNNKKEITDGSYS